MRPTRPQHAKNFQLLTVPLTWGRPDRQLGGCTGLKETTLASRARAAPRPQIAAKMLTPLPLSVFVVLAPRYNYRVAGLHTSALVSWSIVNARLHPSAVRYLCASNGAPCNDLE